MRRESNCSSIKSKSILEPTYDDALGVTAAFNLNLLQRINRELGGNFDLKKFTHRAFYDEERGRIEMHLVSREAQRVQIDEYEVAFAEGLAGEAKESSNLPVRSAISSAEKRPGDPGTAVKVIGTGGPFSPRSVPVTERSLTGR